MIEVAITEKRFGAESVLGPVNFTIAEGETVALNMNPNACAALPVERDR